jgi:hypothetical protein
VIGNDCNQTGGTHRRGRLRLRIQYTDVVRLSEGAKNARDMRYRLLPELLRTSDNVTPHVPLTPLTGNRIGAAALHDALVTGGSPTRDAMRLRPNRPYLRKRCGRSTMSC